MRLRNTFLSLVNSTDRTVLWPHMREITLSDGQLLGAPGDAVERVYFPSSCAISSVAIMADGRGVETASVGFDGVAGLAHALTHEVQSTRMTALIGGAAYVLPANALRAQADRSPALMHLILRFLHAAVEQAEHSSACHAAHHLPARLARWLLICQDRVDRSMIPLTQDGMGMMTWALRSSVSMAASEFKDAGLIRYSRGQVEILNRDGLERLACECYRADLVGREHLAGLAVNQ
jgi:CRP-like cAMP-binding protein